MFGLIWGQYHVCFQQISMFEGFEDNITWFFSKNIYVLVDLRTIPWHCGIFWQMSWGQYHNVLVDLRTIPIGYVLKMSIFWLIFRHSDVDIFWKNIHIIIFGMIRQQYYVDISWKMSMFWLMCQYSGTLYRYFLKMCILFDHLMRFWCGIFSKFIHFGCCGSVLMRIFCIIWQNYSDPNKKVDWSGQIRSSLICSEVQIEKGQTSRNMIVRHSPGTEAAGLRKIESPNVH